MIPRTYYVSEHGDHYYDIQATIQQLHSYRRHHASVFTDTMYEVLMSGLVDLIYTIRIDRDSLFWCPITLMYIQLDVWMERWGSRTQRFLSPQRLRPRQLFVSHQETEVQAIINEDDIETIDGDSAASEDTFYPMGAGYDDDGEEFIDDGAPEVTPEDAERYDRDAEEELEIELMVTNHLQNMYEDARAEELESQTQ